MTLTQPPHTPHAATRPLAFACLVGYACCLVVVLLGPTPRIGATVVLDSMRLLHAVGMPWTTAMFAHVEFIANVVMLLPLAGLGMLIWPRTTWRDWTAGAFVISMAAETLQALLLPARSATFSDVVANTLGGALGAGITALWRWRARSASSRP